MTYQSIAVGPQGSPQEADGWPGLREVVGRAEYDSRNYVRAQGYLQGEGHPEAGDAAFIVQQDWERDYVLQGPTKWWSGVKQWLIGYGRQPWRALEIGAAVVFLAWLGLGAALWRGVKMEKRSPEAANWLSRPLSPAPGGGQRKRESLRFWAVEGPWYSLDVFAPVMSLKSRDAWRPNSQLIEVLEKLLTLLGWVIVPLGVAAITGLVK